MSENKKDIPQNIVKVRDDREPIYFRMKEDNTGFELMDENKLDWCSGSLITKGDLRARVEPWLTSLFQSEHLSLLVGSGLTSAIQIAACGSANNGMSSDTEITVFAEEITKAANESAKKAGRGESNIEDKIRIANDVISGLQVLQGNADFPDIDKKLGELCDELEKILKSFTDNIFAIENSIASADPVKRETAFNKLVLFLMSFASRTGTRDRLNIFTTNYDRLIEAGADVAGLRLVDSFV